jgi:probable rRNA maturation factor
VIEVRNLNKNHRINKKFIAKIAGEVIRILNREKFSELSIVFLSDPAIKPINKKYRQRDRATDVLSFDLGKYGQVLISSDTALKNSRLFNTSFEEEIALYVIHGILHLSGYDDETKTGKDRMSKKEESILKRLCRKRFSKVLMPR